VQRQPGHGIFADPPWPHDGNQYKYKFTEQEQRKLAQVLGCFGQARVVVRYGDHPMIRELYPESRWHWQRFTGRTAANKAKTEVLLVNRSGGNQSGLFGG